MKNSNYRRFNMIVRLTLVCLLAYILATATAEKVWNGFVASWSQNTSNHFYDLPRTLIAAKKEGWSKVTGVNAPPWLTPLGYYGDPTFVILFSKDSGAPAGFQIAIPVKEIPPASPLQWNKLDGIITKKLNGNDSYYTATAYFHENEENNTRVVWLQEKNRMFTVPVSNSTEILANSPFLKKKCVATMGTHYYTWDSTTDCATLYPLGFLGNGDDIIGVIIHGFGNLTALGTRRKWWETLPPFAILNAVANPPECVVNGFEELGNISLHIWFINNPKNLTCHA